TAHDAAEVGMVLLVASRVRAPEIEPPDVVAEVTAMRQPALGEVHQDAIDGGAVHPVLGEQRHHLGMAHRPVGLLQRLVHAKALLRHSEPGVTQGATRVRPAPHRPTRSLAIRPGHGLGTGHDVSLCWPWPWTPGRSRQTTEAREWPNTRRGISAAWKEAAPWSSRLWK